MLKSIDRGVLAAKPLVLQPQRILIMAFQGDSIYWVETEKVVPNPFQPRREFDEHKLKELAESIRMYGVLQPLTVTRHEIQREDGTFYTEYELIAGERRLRATRLAGVAQVPVIIREGEQSEQEKLELAIIENLQREDLNAVDRALAFRQLADQFGLSHVQVAQKVGRSREYVSNSIRLLALPENILEDLKRGEVSEGLARTLLMLNDRPEEQQVVFEEAKLKKLSVRDVERISRRIATEKVRKKTLDDFNDELIEMEKQFTEVLGTRVQIQKTDFGGRLAIDYFTIDDLEAILQRMNAEARGEDVQSTVATLQAATPLQSINAEEETQSSQQVASQSATVTQIPSTEQSTIVPTNEPNIVKPDSETEEMSAMKNILAGLTANLHKPTTEEKKEFTKPESVDTPEPIPVEPTISEAETSNKAEAEKTSEEDDDSGLYSMHRFTV